MELTVPKKAFHPQMEIYIQFNFIIITPIHNNSHLKALCIVRGRPYSVRKKPQYRYSAMARPTAVIKNSTSWHHKDK